MSSTAAAGLAMDLPEVVSETESRAARAQLLAKEKQAMRAGGALAAERRRLPMVEIDKRYVLEGRAGEVTLLDLFDGRRQLIVYHFMFGPNQDEGCDGCSMVVDNLGHLAHLHARDTSFALVSRAPLAKLETYRQRMAWTIPWYSSFDRDFNVDFGVSPERPQADAPARRFAILCLRAGPARNGCVRPKCAILSEVSAGTRPGQTG